MRAGLHRWRELKADVPELPAGSRPASAASRPSSSAASRPTTTYTHFEDKPTFDEVDVHRQPLPRRIHHRQARPARRRLHEVREHRPAAGRRRNAAAAGLAGRADAEAEAGEPAASRCTSSCRRPQSILEEVVPTSFKVKLFKCFLDAAVSEQIARMVAMKSATENAGDLIKRLEHAIQPRPPRPASRPSSWTSSAASKR